MKVLLVDDEPIVLESTRALLEHLGFEVAAVSDAHAILGAIREHRPGVILQDVRMPSLDLPRLLTLIRADPAIGSTRIVLCSASMEVAEIARSVGADDYLEKPYTPRDLVAKINVKSPGD